MFSSLRLCKFRFELCTGLYMLEPWEKAVCYMIILLSNLAIGYSMALLYPSTVTRLMDPVANVKLLVSTASTLLAGAGAGARGAGADAAL